MHYPKGFPSRLVLLRAQAGMTQKDLAAASGISVPQIGRYESGSSAPRMTALVKLAKALGREVSELSDAENQPEIVGVQLASDSPRMAQMAIPADEYKLLMAEAEQHGVSIDVMLSATIIWYRSRVEGSETTIEEAISKAQESLGYENH